jgi:hypothetical protein
MGRCFLRAGRIVFGSIFGRGFCGGPSRRTEGLGGSGRFPRDRSSALNALVRSHLAWGRLGAIFCFSFLGFYFFLTDGFSSLGSRRQYLHRRVGLWAGHCGSCHQRSTPDIQ